MLHVVHVSSLKIWQMRIKSGHIAGAAVDVFQKEPKANGEEFQSPLRGLDNVILTIARGWFYDGSASKHRF